MNIMEFIWDTVERPGDGSEMIYTKDDAEALWELGFVDTGRFPKSDWFQALQPFLEQDGNFHFSKGEFLSLDSHRYQGEIKIPFNALEINEGKYTDEGIQELVDLSVAPSLSLSKSALQKKIDALKQKYRQKDGLILVKMPAKQEIRVWIDADPSPLHRLELLFADFLKQRGFLQESVKEVKAHARVATPQEQARVQASAFSILPSTVVEAKAGEFKKMAKAKTHTDTAEDDSKPKLKKIKRSPKGTRG